MVAGAKNDCLLVRGAVARGEDALEEVGGHGLDAIRQDKLAFERGAIVENCYRLRREGLPGVKVCKFLGRNIGAEDAADPELAAAAAAAGPRTAHSPYDVDGPAAVTVPQNQNPVLLEPGVMPPSDVQIAALLRLFAVRS